MPGQAARPGFRAAPTTGPGGGRRPRPSGAGATAGAPGRADPRSEARGAARGGPRGSARPARGDIADGPRETRETRGPGAAGGAGRPVTGKPRPNRSGGKARTPFRPPQNRDRAYGAGGAEGAQRGRGGPGAGGFRRAPPGDVDGWAGDAGAGYPPAFLPPDFDRPGTVPTGPSQKLQKVLADAGIGSRRAMETLIGRGAVTVNGRLATIGTRVMTGDGTHPGDVIAIDGRRIRARAGECPKVLLYHKPEGEIVSHDDPAGRTSVFDALPRLRNGKWLSVGRLDFNTSGLLIFTDSGEFANALMHPRFGNEREYAVRVLGSLTPEQLRQLTSGIELADGPARFESIHDGGGDGANRWYRVVVTEGRNRLVRRLFEANRLTVSRLMRVRFGPIELPSKLKRGQFLSLTDEEVGAIQARIERDMDSATDKAPAGASAGAGAPSRAQERSRARRDADDLPPLGVPEGRPGRKRLDRRVARAPVQGTRGNRPPSAEGRPAPAAATGKQARGRSGAAGRSAGGDARAGAKPRAGASARPAAPAGRGPRAPAGRPKTPARSSRSR